MEALQQTAQDLFNKPWDLVAKAPERLQSFGESASTLARELSETAGTLANELVSVKTREVLAEAPLQQDITLARKHRQLSVTADRLVDSIKEKRTELEESFLLIEEIQAAIAAREHILEHHQRANDALQQRFDGHQAELAQMRGQHDAAMASHRDRLVEQHAAALRRMRDEHADALSAEIAATHAMVEELNAEFDDELRLTEADYEAENEVAQEEARRRHAAVLKTYEALARQEEELAQRRASSCATSFSAS